MRFPFQLPSGLALAAALIGGVLCIATPVAAQVSALVPSDAEGLSCKAIAAEMNAVAQAGGRPARRPAGPRKLFGFAAQALQMAGPMLGASGLGNSGLGAVAAQAAQTAAMTAAQAHATSAGEAASASTGEAQHLEHLSALYADKGC